jgi:hypothetical protein
MKIQMEIKSVFANNTENEFKLTCMRQSMCMEEEPKGSMEDRQEAMETSIEEETVAMSEERSNVTEDCIKK